MKKEDIVIFRFDVNLNGKKFKEGTAAVVVEVNKKFDSKTVTIFIDGSVIRVPTGYIKSMKDE